MVDLVGIEPTTSSMPWKRAPKLRHRPTKAGNSPIVSTRDPIRQTPRLHSSKTSPGAHILHPASSDGTF